MRPEGIAVRDDPDAFGAHTRVRTGADSDRRKPPPAAAWSVKGPQTAFRERRPIIMLAIIALALIVLVALAVLSFTVHILFSPWLLVMAIAAFACIKFRPRRSQR